MSNDTVLIGCGAGFAGDRFDAGLPVVRAMAADGRPAFMMFETLAERTLALAQQRRRQGQPGWLPAMDDFLRPVLALCREARVPIIANFGSADPVGAARQVQKLARQLGLPDLKVAAVLGDDLFETFGAAGIAQLPMSPALPVATDALVAANAYIGATAIAQALGGGAEIVLTGRVADPALALGPLMHAFAWGEQQWDLLAAGTLAGHLLECGAQLTGGYFMDPSIKDVPDPANLGYPIAEISRDGSLVLGKPAGTGGRIDGQTVREQMLYEIHDPSAYLTPDVVLDLSAVRIEDLGQNRVRVSGAKGHARPATLKATLCYDAGFIGEAGISYAGPNAAARARLAIEILRERVGRIRGLTLQFDLIGLSSVFNDPGGQRLARFEQASHDDLRVRMAVQGSDREAVQHAMQEFESLYCAGPAAGGGVRTTITPQLGSVSAWVPREQLRPYLHWASDS